MQIAHTPFLPDLTLWYGWHRQMETLPARWRRQTLPQICRSLGVPIWMTARTHRLEWGLTEIKVDRSDGKRIVRYESPFGTLREGWEKGPDGDWWQTEFPVKTVADLGIAGAMLSARAYRFDRSAYDNLYDQVGEDGIVAIELPRRPFSQLFLEWLGWSDGLMLFFEAEAAIAAIVELLEEQVQALVRAAANLPAAVFVSPDNLDAQFVSPAYFSHYLAPSYSRSAATLHAQGKQLMVGTGGYIRRLLPLLTQAGVDAVQGISGPPQSDATLAEARAAAGPDLLLWGGIPQDALLEDFPESEFETVVQQAAQEAGQDGRAILGVADVVPVAADIARLERIPDLVRVARAQV
jgi:hypothetical protein